MKTIKVFVKNFSLETYAEQGIDFGDNGFQELENYSKQENEYLLSCLTNRQRQVVALIFDGYTRKETAKKLGVSWQAIHQIVLRIRKRLIIKANVSI